jgi:hypothetical protein
MDGNFVTFLGLQTKTVDCPSLNKELVWFEYKVFSLVSCAQRLFVNTTGLLRGGFTLKGEIDSVRSWFRAPSRLRVSSSNMEREGTPEKMPEHAFRKTCVQ